MPVRIIIMAEKVNFNRKRGDICENNIIYILLERLFKGGVNQFASRVMEMEIGELPL